MTWWLMFMVGMAGMNALVLAQPGQTEFIPVSKLPAGEQLPAARLLIAAYAFIWVAVLGYVWMMWRKLDKVEREIADLSAHIAKKRP
jgi:CcmD family protein